MANLVNANLENGSIQYYGKIDAIPASSETNGNVTVKNAAVDEVPAYYDVSFLINSNFEELGIQFNNVFHWHCAVKEEDSFAQYRLIEDQAAQAVPTMLRVLADRLEERIVESAKQREKAKKGVQ